MSASLLPEQFSDLEPFAEAWALKTEVERRAKRSVSDMTEIKAFYDTMLGRITDVFEYLNQYPLESMPEPAERLFLLTLSLAEIAPAVEFYGQPEVVDGFPAHRFVPLP